MTSPCGGIQDVLSHNIAECCAKYVDVLRAQGLSDEEILDVAMAAAARCFFSKVMDAVGAEPEARYLSDEPPTSR